MNAVDWSNVTLGVLFGCGCLLLLAKAIERMFA